MNKIQITPAHINMCIRNTPSGDVIDISRISELLVDTAKKFGSQGKKLLIIAEFAIANYNFSTISKVSEKVLQAQLELAINELQALVNFVLESDN
jgi:hypothetical protein